MNSFVRSYPNGLRQISLLKITNKKNTITRKKNIHALGCASFMLNIVLVEPEIPQNTGNIARTCAITGSRLHLVRPLGFDISDKAVKRAGLDYWHFLDIKVYRSIRAFFEINGDSKIWLATTKAPRDYTQAQYEDGCFLLFGKETAGLPAEMLKKYYDRCVRIPMIPNARSMNLGSSVAVICYEALRQHSFQGLACAGEMANRKD
jgi:tRNA (cytidine/uridine-2'-O-)-methyltransferase